eukprot:gb/GECH01004408.1/.p1 GENE.gb/GECH01004408.1/~~gb/GECH01004408.1/.p1  ORF type:complete len:128 (+),score=31.73 gb/GECH01004408.1/:1-384(+)
MKPEIYAASTWWTEQISDNVSPQCAEEFRKALATEINKRLDGHWDEERPMKGSGYRSILNDARMDSIFIYAANAAGISDLSCLNIPKAVMWVNPGSVCVRGFVGGWKRMVYPSGFEGESQKDNCKAF